MSEIEESIKNISRILNIREERIIQMINELIWMDMDMQRANKILKELEDLEDETDWKKEGF
ncbi:MAG: hypothetical protein WDZ51_06205 [Pirellulaceae bacterium]